MDKPFIIKVVDGILVVRFFTKPFLSEIFQAQSESRGMGDFSLRLWVFEDGLDLNENEIIQIGYNGRKLWPGERYRIAYVVRDDLSYGLARMHSVYRSEEHYYWGQAFRDETEAINWLK